MKNLFRALLFLCLAVPALAQNPNVNSTTPAAPSGATNCVWQFSGVNASCYIPSGTYDASGAASSALTTAEASAANASNLTSGTVAPARLPGAGSTTVNGQTCTLGSTCTISAGGTSPTISGLAYSQDDTTIVATWYTNVQSNGSLTCGAKIDNAPNYEMASTFHQHVVTGLTASTLYSCAVTSGSTTSSSTNVTTTAAPTQTAITSTTYGTFTQVASAPSGDSYFSFVSNDNITYLAQNDGHGFVIGSPNSGSNMQLGKLTNESTYAGANINQLTNYGGFATANGTDGPSGAALSNKISGMIGFSGKLFLFEYRQYDSVSGGPLIVSPAFFGNVMRTDDHGATFNSWQNITQTQANGVPPNPLGSYQFTSTGYANCVPVRYGVDDGSIGMITPGNRFNGGNAWVYAACNDGYWSNGTNLYMMRMSRASMLQNVAAPAQYWHGPTSPTSANFVNDSYWTTSPTSATAIYSSTSEVSTASIDFIPGFDYYVMHNWYYPSGSVTNNTVLQTLASPTPGGPWTVVNTTTSTPAGEYGCYPAHRSIATNTLTSSAPITDLCSGDFGAGASTYYKLTYVTETINPPSPAATPTFSPGAGSYGSAQTVTISATSGSVICYNTTGSPATNGTTGCTTGTLYTAPVSVPSSETLYAVAGGTGYSDSSVGSATYTISGSLALATYVAGGNTTTSSSTVSTAQNSTPAASFNMVAGNSLLVGISTTSPVTVSSVADLAGCSFSQVGSTQTVGSDTHTWYLANACSTGSSVDVVTVTTSASEQYTGVTAYQIGSGTSLSLDTQPAYTTATGTSVTTPSFNTTHANDVVACDGYQVSGSNHLTAGTGFTQGSSAVGGGYVNGEYRVYTSTQTGATGSFTFASSISMDIACIAVGH